ncbi:MAG: hypothetical protein AAGD32_04130 [Planctomycetota bacterium]
MTYGQPNRITPVTVAPQSGGLTFVGILSIVVAAVTMLLAMGGGLFVGSMAAIVASNTAVTWTLTPTGATLGNVGFLDTTATDTEVEFMLTGMQALQPLGDVQEDHLRRLLAAHGRSAFPDAASADDVTAAIQMAAPDGVGGVFYALNSAGRFNVDADGAEWLDPIGNRHASADLLDPEDVAGMQTGYYGWKIEDDVLDAAVRRINADLDTPLEPDVAELVRGHLADEAAMPLGWAYDASVVDEQLLSCERDADGALVLQLAQGTYTLPAGSTNATYVAHNGMPTDPSAATGGWFALLGAMGLFAGSGVLLTAGIQTVRLKHSGTWLHWLAVAGLLLSAALAIVGSAMFSSAMPNGSSATGLIASGAMVAVPVLYALVLIGVLLFGPLRKPELL